MPALLLADAASPVLSYNAVLSSKGMTSCRPPTVLGHSSSLCLPCSAAPWASPRQLGGAAWMSWCLPPCPAPTGGRAGLQRPCRLLGIQRLSAAVQLPLACGNLAVRHASPRAGIDACGAGTTAPAFLCRPSPGSLQGLWPLSRVRPADPRGRPRLRATLRVRGRRAAGRARGAQGQAAAALPCGAVAAALSVLTPVTALPQDTSSCLQPARQSCSAVHLGRRDYCYEYEKGMYPSPRFVARHGLRPKHRCTSLQDYRQRYACYRCAAP